MTLTSKHVIFIAVSNYLGTENAQQLKNECIAFKRLTDSKFIKLIEKYFDFKLLRDKPIIPEDIWLFNYLMYETTKKDDYKIYEIGDKITFKGRLKKKGLLIKYYNRIIMPQLLALKEAGMILENLT